MFCYSDTEPRSPFNSANVTPVSAWSTERVMGAWRTHAENRAFLDFMLKRGTTLEKSQASAELRIADRKLKFWANHPAFDLKTAERALINISKTWRG
jgi:hypothetical protein